MTRVPYERIFIRDTDSGPDIVFDAGVQGWPIPCTEQDLDELEEVLVVRRHAREAPDAQSPVTPEVPRS